jgi:RNA polymerase sigma factor (sigma-70 family)
MSTATATTRPAPAATLSTTTLLRRATKGDPSAWEEIVRRYSPLVVTRVRTFRLQDADTLDAVQMTWLRLAENCQRIRCPEHLGGWLATTATHECIRICRQGKHTTLTTEATWENTPDPTTSLEQHIIDTETMQVLRDLVTDLPPRQRTLIQALFTTNPRSYAEVARTTGIPIGSIGPTRARALEQLRRSLNKHKPKPEDDRPQPAPRRGALSSCWVSSVTRGGTDRGGVS